MTTMSNSFRDVAPNPSIRGIRGFFKQSGFSALIRRVSRTIKSDPLVVLIGFFDAIFYGGVVALLAVL